MRNFEKSIAKCRPSRASDRGVAVPEASEISPSKGSPPEGGGAVVAVLDEAGSRTAFEFRGLVA